MRLGKILKQERHKVEKLYAVEESNFSEEFKFLSPRRYYKDQYF